MTDTERPDDLIPLAEVADLLKVSVRTVFRYRAAGKLRFYKDEHARGRPVHASREQVADLALQRFIRLYGRRQEPA